MEEKAMWKKNELLSKESSITAVEIVTIVGASAYDAWSDKWTVEIEWCRGLEKYAG